MLSPAFCWLASICAAGCLAGGAQAQAPGETWTAYSDTVLVCKDAAAARQANAIADRMYRNKIAMDGVRLTDYGASCAVSQVLFTPVSFAPVAGISRTYSGYLSAQKVSANSCKRAGTGETGRCVPCTTMRGEPRQCISKTLESVFVDATAYSADGRHLKVVVELPPRLVGRARRN